MLARFSSLAARRAPSASFAPSARLFATSTPSGKSNAPDSNTKTKGPDYDGTADSKDKIPLPQEQGNGEKKGQQAELAEHAKKNSSVPKASTTPAPKETRERKMSGTSGNFTPSDKHRNSQEYSHRDQGTGSEASVAADRSGQDPLPDSQKHSEKVNFYRNISCCRINSYSKSTNSRRKLDGR